MCPQDRTEAILLARLRALGGEVIRLVEVTGVDLGASGARVQIAVGEATQTVAARWVIGCDGMHSQVREAAGIAFNGAAYEPGFILADVHMDWPLGRGEVSLFFSPAGLVVVAPLPKDRFRVVATVDDPPEVPSVPYVQALLDARGPRASQAHIHDSIWSSRFKVHHRQVPHGTWLAGHRGGGHCKRSHLSRVSALSPSRPSRCLSREMTPLSPLWQP